MFHSDSFIQNGNQEVRVETCTSALMDGDRSDCGLISYELMTLATQVLGDQETARTWFHAPAIGLSGAKPVDVIKNEQGNARVLELLQRMQYGVYC